MFAVDSHASTIHGWFLQEMNQLFRKIDWNPKAALNEYICQ